MINSSNQKVNYLDWDNFNEYGYSSLIETTKYLELSSSSLRPRFFLVSNQQDQHGVSLAYDFDYNLLLQFNSGNYSFLNYFLNITNSLLLNIMFELKDTTIPIHDYSEYIETSSSSTVLFIILFIFGLAFLLTIGIKNGLKRKKKEGKRSFKKKKTFFAYSPVSRLGV